MRCALLALVAAPLALFACAPSASDSAVDGGADAPSREVGVGAEGGSDVVIGDGSHASDGSGGATGAMPGQVPPARGQPAWLHASGSAILDSRGDAVRLHGVNRSGTEYACVEGFGIFDGPSDAASVAAIKAWHANAVRIPLNEDCWLGINGVDAAYSGAAYRSAIVAYVDLLLASGVYPILDLHWSAPGGQVAMGQQPMPDGDHSVSFWGQVAATFKADSDVVFELFNEPWPDSNQDTDAAWACWRDGGTCAGVSYPVAGMQKLLDTVRAEGAGNLVLLGGVEYSNALTQWLAYKPNDTLDNVAAAWHVYPSNLCADSSCWNGVPDAVSKKFPVVATEVGDDSCNAAFPASVMSWLDAQGQSYLGWAWDTFGSACSNYALITAYDGTPNGAYGQAFKAHFLAEFP